MIDNICLSDTVGSLYPFEFKYIVNNYAYSYNNNWKNIFFILDFLFILKKNNKYDNEYYINKD